jgi:squalene cyclase
MTPELREKVRKGLEWLKKNMNADGSGRSGGGEQAGVMALAGIAFMADGNTPGEGRYGAEVDKILEFILKNCQSTGLISANNGSPMYGHGFATLFLAEAYGMTKREDVKEKLQLAVRLIVQSQNKEGGWRYQPVPNDADLSVTIAQVMALRAARNAGIKVPKKTIDAAIDYVKKSQEPDGGFSYMLQSRGSSYPRSAAGVACLFYSGIYDGKEIEKGVKYLLSANNKRGNEYHFYYGQYYATQAMFMAGGASWEQFWPAIRKELLKRQAADGSWTGEVGGVYSTSMALIALQVPNRLLPILQK